VLWGRLVSARPVGPRPLWTVASSRAPSGVGDEFQVGVCGRPQGSRGINGASRGHPGGIDVGITVHKALMPMPCFGGITMAIGVHTNFDELFKVLFFFRTD